ncbi:MAG: Maf family nucleotide pyrophosphatase [Candidatus Wildermuthbacteria bacterium]|nr:Maf family nucleotide pyrophosphatase [Candidatus Wildermuthbacteria bacterium]
MSKIILATTSPYRREAFAFLGIDFEAVGSNVDESQVDRANPEELVKKLSKSKAEAVAKNYPDAIVIGMDSVGCFNGKILEKPKSKEEGFERLKSLSGKCYDFYTGVHMINTATREEVARVVKTEITMRDLSETEIKTYLDEDPNFNKYAHGYDIKNKRSSSFVSKINGSYNNALMGIPLEFIPKMLVEVGLQ